MKMLLHRDIIAIDSPLGDLIDMVRVCKSIMPQVVTAGCCQET